MKHSPVFALAVCLSFVAFSCASVPKNIPESLTASELIQKAQEASDLNNFDAAVVYYKTALERYSHDMQTVTACKYELAFIDYKKGDYAVAGEALAAIVKQYSEPDAAILPAQYKILAETVLASIAKKTGKQ